MLRGKNPLLYKGVLGMTLNCTDGEAPVLEILGVSSHPFIAITPGHSLAQRSSTC